MKELNDNDLKKITNLFSEEEIIALEMGFPISEDLGIVLDEDGLEVNFIDDTESDDEFNDFLTRKSRDRIRKRRALRKAGVKRAEARRRALSEIPRDSLKKALKKVSLNNIRKDLKKVVRIAKVGTFLLPRQSFIGLVALNYRGLAWKLEAVEYGNNQNLKNKLKDKWVRRLGGNYSKLVGAINKGRRKKPFFCGKKCKGRVSEYSNYEPATATISAMIVTGGSILGYMASIVKQGMVNKSKKRELETAKDISDNEVKSMSDAEKLRADTEQKLIDSQADPRNMIMNNSNLTPKEKRDALALYDSTFGSERKAKLIKYSIIGVVALGGIFLLTRVLRNK